MSLENVICTYIYGTFQALKILFDLVKGLAMRFIDMINAIANALNSIIDTMMSAALTAMVESIMKLLNKLSDMLNPLNFSTGGNLCDASWKCAFLLKDILDKNTSSGEAMTCVIGERTSDQLLNMMNSFSTFADAICNFGVSVNIGINAMKTALKQFRKQVEKWIDIIDKKIEKIHFIISKFTVFLKRDFEKMGIIATEAQNILDLLSKLALFINCVLNDSTECAAIDTAISFYYNALDILCLAPDGDSFGISSDALENWVGKGNTFKQKCNGALALIDDALIKLENPAGAVGAANAYDVSKEIVGLGKASTSSGGLKNNLRKVPIFNKILNTKDEVLIAWRKDHSTSSNCDNEILRNMLFDEEHGEIYVGKEKVRIKVRTEAPPLNIHELEVNPGCDTAGLSTPISMSDGSMTSAREAALECFLYESNPEAYPQYAKIHNYCKECNSLFIEQTQNYNLARKVGY